ncbi:MULTISPECIES: TetR/AcrR family transcriptional regulator [unclassified Pseudonocardia]|uniref:TetR/AcrR family transcriptional regulator n=1 Tax=unclassified Pseudonocardia TaxID=2619320 RepID=UPI000760CFDF|nr:MULTISPECIES: TetR/AcrR family transcriptional regulator [unclassified Pseudonocardia]
MSIRERILDATARIIREDGIAAVRTKRIAALADCSEGSIFKHFEDKGALLAAVLTYGLPEGHALVEAGARARDAFDLRAGLVVLTDATRDYYRASLPMSGSALSDRGLFERYASAHRKAGTGPHLVWERIAAYLAVQQDRGTVTRDVDVRMEAMTLAGACQYAAWVEMISGLDAVPYGRDFIARLVDSRIAALSPSDLDIGT